MPEAVRCEVASTVARCNGAMQRHEGCCRLAGVSVYRGEQGAVPTALRLRHRGGRRNGRPNVSALVMTLMSPHTILPSRRARCGLKWRSRGVWCGRARTSVRTCA